MWSTNLPIAKTATGNCSIHVAEAVVANSPISAAIIDFQTSFGWWRAVHQPHCQPNKHARPCIFNTHRRTRLGLQIQQYKDFTVLKLLTKCEMRIQKCREGNAFNCEVCFVVHILKTSSATAAMFKIHMLPFFSQKSSDINKISLAKTKNIWPKLKISILIWRIDALLDIHFIHWYRSVVP